VHFLEKAVTPDLDTEWAMRLYNQDNPTRHSLPRSLANGRYQKVSRSTFNCSMIFVHGVCPPSSPLDAAVHPLAPCGVPPTRQMG
jgi:hypothetical protein